jgi:hypothetical protein
MAKSPARLGRVLINHDARIADRCPLRPQSDPNMRSSIPMLRNIVSQRFGIPFTLKAPDSRSIRRSRLRTAMAVSVKARGKVLFERRSSQRLQLQGLDPESAAVGDYNDACAGRRAHCRAHWAGGSGISRVPAPVGGSNPALGRVLGCGQRGMHPSGLAGALTLGAAARGPRRPGDDHPRARSTDASAKWRSTSIRCTLCVGRFPAWRKGPDPAPAGDARFVPIARFAIPAAWRRLSVVANVPGAPGVLGSGQTLADGGHRGRQDGLQVLSADVAVRSARRGMGNGHG